ncbi:MAG: long-chain fatty acid--CoA ligase [Clostridia bacterium]
MAYLEGLMMDYPLDVGVIWRRAEQYFGHKPVVSELPDRTLHRSNYGEVLDRAARLGAALMEMGIEPGDRVATFMWNSYHHLELYFAVPAIGAVLHTVNLRLHAQDLVYIFNHADDKIIFVDRTVLALIAPIRDRLSAREIVVVDEGETAPPGFLSYQDLVRGGAADRFQFRIADERQAAALCYTSGTTGRPKGVLYSHRSTVLHALGTTNAEGGLGVVEADVISPMVPMFHVNAWGLPWVAALQGAALALPGRHLDPASLLQLFAEERVTITAGVPTVWIGVLQLLDQDPGRYDVSSIRYMLVGGAAMPAAIMRAFWERHHIRVIHAWGMTETSPLGSISTLKSDLIQTDADTRYRYLATQGQATALVEMRIRDDEGRALPWDGQAQGELEVRGPWIARSYFALEEGDDRFTSDGWFRTGDLVTIEPRGYMTIQDRSKDVIKSGGEWISSVALENAIMGHPSVLEAAVIGMPDERWGERPLAVAVLKPGERLTLEEVREYLKPHFASWWLPDRLEIADAIPRSAAGKFQKTELRRKFIGAS